MFLFFLEKILLKTQVKPCLPSYLSRFQWLYTGTFLLQVAYYLQFSVSVVINRNATYLLFAFKISVLDFW